MRVAGTLQPESGTHRFLNLTNLRNLRITMEVGRMKKFLKYGIPVLAVYLVLASGMFWAMTQPPLVFNRIMAKMPTFTYFLFPFEPMWYIARRGHVKVGELAPDFDLKTADRASEVRLSSFRGQKPVALIFGSHT